MRGRLYLNSMIIREICPRNLKHAIDNLIQTGDLATDELDNNRFNIALLENSDLIEGEVTPEAVDCFLKFNQHFFTEGNSGSRSLSEIAQDLNQSCAVLIHHGHIDCWNYGWSFFQDVQELYKS